MKLDIWESKHKTMVWYLPFKQKSSFFFFFSFFFFYWPQQYLILCFYFMYLIVWNLSFFVIFFPPTLFVFITVPVDVFSPKSEWRGFYEYLGKKQATKFSVSGFNATSGRVNVTLLETSEMSIQLSGKKSKVRPLRVKLFDPLWFSWLWQAF